MLIDTIKLRVRDIKNQKICFIKQSKSCPRALCFNERSIAELNLINLSVVPFSKCPLDEGSSSITGFAINKHNLIFFMNIEYYSYASTLSCKFD